jgi:hypothetical protein
MEQNFNTDTIEGYSSWISTLRHQDLQDEIDERSFDSELNDTGQWGDYDARYRAALAEQNRRVDLVPPTFYTWLANAKDNAIIARARQAQADFRAAFASDDDTGMERANQIARACKNRLHELGY